MNYIDKLLINKDKVNFLNVTFIFTFKCNARCAHCLYECSPERNEKFQIFIIKEALKSLHNLGINHFTLTGGEPLLFIKEVEEILTFANSLNIKSLIGSNGFWGKTYEDAFNILKKLHSLGLRKLLLSVDKFHQNFIDVEKLFNILKSAEEIGIKVKITVNMTRKDTESIELIKKFKKYNCVISLKEPKLVGRALKSVNEADLYSFTLRGKQIKEIIIPCDQIGLPAITPDGRVWICCGLPSARYYNYHLKNTPLILGNIYDNSLEKILNDHKDNPMLKILKFYGPLKFVEIIENATGYKYEFVPKYYRICDLCCNILGSQKYLNIIQKKLK